MELGWNCGLRHWNCFYYSSRLLSWESGTSSVDLATCKASCYDKGDECCAADDKNKCGDDANFGCEHDGAATWDGGGRGAQNYTYVDFRVRKAVSTGPECIRHGKCGIPNTKSMLMNAALPDLCSLLRPGPESPAPVPDRRSPPRRTAKPITMTSSVWTPSGPACGSRRWTTRP